MSGDLAFNINYPVVEISCLDAGCMGKGCNAVHRRHTGEATLTVVGSIQRIQQIASEIIPGWPVTPEAPTPAADVVLTSRELDAMRPGETVMAGGFADGARNEQHEWVKLRSGRWETARQERVDDKCGVSSIWLAHNRGPKRLT